MGWALYPMSVTVREKKRIFGSRDTQRRDPGEDGGRDWSEVTASSGTPEAPRSRSSRKKLPVDFEGTDTFILDFWPLKL